MGLPRGGLTLLPAVLVAVWYLGTSPVGQESITANTQDGTASGQRRKSNGSTHGKDSDNVHLGVGIDDEILEKLKGRTHEPDACAGYFAVCREYVPGGVNGKPPDRTTPAGAVVAVESPSVYQSIYRGIFDRNKTTSPSIEATNAKNKKARNVFYVVLRLGHLMLYDNEDKLEVRHVISLAHYKVDIYGGGERIPEGELWIKRNCIRLIRQLDNNGTDAAKGFYLKIRKTPRIQTIPLFHSNSDTPDLVKLVQQLHASEENLHTRWINALIGRVFLALYKTSQVKDFIASKINKKIARVPKPAIISSVQLRKVDMGTLPPFITNPKLKELTVDGDLVVEADVSYKGNFRIEISATVRIDLGTRFKAREVTLVLATVLKRLDGHILIRVKPPPSNRLWMTFETPPKMEFSLEPIVSSRQITYGVVLRAIEGRIREVVNETLVLPNWDDMPFTDTIAQIIRGGIWEDSAKDDEEDTDKIKQDEATLETAISDAEKLDEKADLASAHFSIASSVDSEEVGTGISSSTDHKSSSSSVRPRAMRSSSSVAQVKIDSSNASAEIAHDRTMTPTSVKSLPVTSPTKSPVRPKSARKTTESSESSLEDTSAASIYAESTASAPVPTTEHSRTRSKELTAQEIAAAAAAAAGAKQYGDEETNNQSVPQLRHSSGQELARQPSRTPSPTPIPIIDHRHLKAQTQIMTRRRRRLWMPVRNFSQTPRSPNPTQNPWAEANPSHPRAHLSRTLKTRRDRPGPSPPLPQTHLLISQNGNPYRPYYQLACRFQQEINQDARTGGGNNAGEENDGEDVFREMRRRKSSAASNELATPPPPLPKRRQRQPSLNLSAHQRRASQNQNLQPFGMGEELLVVEAPVIDGKDDEGSRERGNM
ncbi:unnamed protein product [Alternaria alternata]